MRSIARRLVPAVQSVAAGTCSTSCAGASAYLHVPVSEPAQTRPSGQQHHHQHLLGWQHQQAPWCHDRQGRLLSTSAAPGAPDGAGASPSGAASDRVKELAEQITQLTVLECSQLSELVRLKLNMPRPSFSSMPMMAPSGAVGAAPAAAPSASAAPAAEVKEKTEFDVKLDSFSPEGKIKVIKEVRTITAFGLKEAKELVEKAPVVIKTGLTKAEAETIKKQLETAGAKVSLV